MEMTPIISPWFFYFAAKVEMIHMFAWILLFATLIIGIITLCEASNSDNEEDAERAKKIFKKPCIIVCIIMCLILLIVPCRDTLVQMLIAENITYERLEVVGDGIESVYEDIMNLANQMIGTNNESSSN
jgi:hypothetical protein